MIFISWPLHWQQKGIFGIFRYFGLSCGFSSLLQPIMYFWKANMITRTLWHLTSSKHRCINLFYHIIWFFKLPTQRTNKGINCNHFRITTNIIINGVLHSNAAIQRNIFVVWYLETAIILSKYCYVMSNENTWLFKQLLHIV